MQIEIHYLKLAAKILHWKFWILISWLYSRRLAVIATIACANQGLKVRAGGLAMNGKVTSTQSAGLSSVKLKSVSYWPETIVPALLLVDSYILKLSAHLED